MLSLNNDPIGQFRELRRAIYDLLPTDCLLKPRNTLSGKMVTLISAGFIKQGLIEHEDICSLCPKKECPHNAVKNKEVRIVKIEHLNGAEIPEA